MVQMREQCKHHIQKHFKGMEKALADGREFLTGNTLTLADVGMVTIFETDGGGWMAEDLEELEERGNLLVSIEGEALVPGCHLQLRAGHHHEGAGAH